MVQPNLSRWCNFRLNDVAPDELPLNFRSDEIEKVRITLQPAEIKEDLAKIFKKVRRKHRSKPDK